MQEIIDKLKTYFNEWKHDITAFTSSFKATKQNMANLQAQIPEVKKTVSEVQRSVEKMKFKNQPRLDRIKATQAHMQAELDRFKKK
ncbi:MAG: hypothetical protein LBT80_02150 [Lactobacillaceae bacterium]|jgi:septal ring factor EnvC (AmiA/AmiB activator)|nr:hypothetical protein [Lactobacillaceae bacterium]